MLNKSCLVTVTGLSERYNHENNFVSLETSGIARVPQV